MKKVGLLIVLAISFTFFSCEKDEKKELFTATAEYCESGKTFLERNYDDTGNEYFEIKWEIGDDIQFSTVRSPYYEGVEERITFVVNGISQDYRTAYVYATNHQVDPYFWCWDLDLGPFIVYPPCIITYSGEPYLSEGHMLFNNNSVPVINLSSIQYYDETRTVRHLPMWGHVTNPFSHGLNVRFYNLCGLLRIKIKDGRDNATRVKKIKISSSNEISGYFELRSPLCPANGIYHFQNWDDDLSRYVMEDRHLSGTNFIELTCSNANNGTGVPLASDGTDFYFYVPPTMMNDMVIEVTNMDDEVATKDLSGHNIQVMRSQLTGIKVDFTNVPFI